MSHLQIFPASGSHPLPSFASNDPALIAAELAERGIGFERWPAHTELPASASADAVLAAQLLQDAASGSVAELREACETLDSGIEGSNSSKSS